MQFIHWQQLSSPVLGVFEVKLDKDHHGLGITIAGYTDQTGLFTWFAFTVFSIFTTTLCNRKNLILLLLCSSPLSL